MSRWNNYSKGYRGRRDGVITQSVNGTWLRCHTERPQDKCKARGLSNNISISYDISLYRYVVKTYDLINGSLSALILLNGLWTYKTSNAFSGPFFIGLAMFGFLLIVMTELKIKSLREYMDVFNLAQQAKQRD